MPAQPEPPTVAEVVHRAAQVCDPPGQNADVADLLVRFEDSDEPVTVVPDIEQRLWEAVGVLDPDGDEPALAMAAAVAIYLAHRRDQVDDDRESLLRLAARAEFDGDPPPYVADWLAAEGVSG